MSIALRLPLVASALSDPMAALASKPRSLLRFITCGSVDDGKSTLIGRVLFETGAVSDDLLDALDVDSARHGTIEGQRDYALLVDGLAAEREQGITIDVAYRYFATSRRSFIVADTPGHEQYTRNMATGASTADLAILLVDARKGLLPQTKRHAYIVSTVGVRHVVLAVNKMDLVDFDEATFRRIEAAFRPLAAQLGFTSVTAIPVAARDGDNLAAHSPRMAWHQGPALLPFLETVELGERGAYSTGFAMPVQWVNRPDAEFRGFSGTIATGHVQPGDAVLALPSGRESRVSRIVTADGDLNSGVAGMAVTLVLEDEIDLSRGDVIGTTQATALKTLPRISEHIEARLIVTGEIGIAVGSTFVIKLGTATANATVTAIRHAVDIESYANRPTMALGLNAIGQVRLRLDKPLVHLDYAASHVLGGFILIDKLSNATTAFGFVLPDAPADDRLSAAPGPWLDPWLGPDRGARPLPQLSVLTARIISAGVMAAIAGGLSGKASMAILAGLADLILRPIARLVHDSLCRRITPGVHSRHAAPC